MKRNAIDAFYSLFRQAKWMDNSIRVEPNAEEIARMQQTIEQYLTEVEQLRRRMQSDQAEIEASRDRTDVMLTRIQAQLAQLQAS